MSFKRALARSLSDIDRLKNEYKNNQPFPHIIIDNLWQNLTLHRILYNVYTEYGNYYDDKDFYRDWDVRSQDGVQVKYRTNWKKQDDIPEDVNHFISQYLNGGDFLRFLTDLTGIEGLIADPYLDGGGINEIKKGGHLAIHCDGNKNKRMGIYRALNVIIYLNSNWKEEYGGHLNFYNKDLTLAKSILPIFNRTVIFTTNQNSLHGHPEPLNCPEDMSRKSLILYYYTKDNLFNNDSEEDIPHSAKFIDSKGNSLL